MKLAFSTLGCPDWTLDQIASCVEANGYEGLELRGLQREFSLPDCPALAPGERAAVRRRFEGLGCALCAVDSSATFSSPEEQERSKAVDEVRRYAELGADLGSRLIRVFGGNLAAGHTMDETISFMADSLRRAAEAAAEAGLALVVETHDAFCLGADLARVLAAADHWLRASAPDAEDAKPDHPACLALWDVHHPLAHGESVADTVRHLGSRLAHVHTKDARTVDGQRGYCLFGEGDVPYREVFTALAEHGYTGYLSLEWEKAWHPDLLEPEIAIPQYAQAARQLLAEIGVA
jgi:sugar phosphate isomerase/epimerase